MTSGTSPRTSSGCRSAWRSSSSRTAWWRRWPASPSGPGSTPRWCSRPAATACRPRPPRWASASPSRRKAAGRSYRRVDDLIGAYPLRGIKEVGRYQAGPARPGRRPRAARPPGAGRPRPSRLRPLPPRPGLSRSLDFDVVSALVQATAGPASLATVRLMAGQELVTEGFVPGQVGSSAMPHKMNTDPRSGSTACPWWCGATCR